MSVCAISARACRCRIARGLLDLGRQCVLEAVGMELKALAVSGAGVPCAQNAIRDFSGGKVRLGLLNDAAERLESIALRIDGVAHARVDGDAVEVFEPRDAHAFEVAIKGAREEAARLAHGERRADVRACDRAECEGEASALERA